MLDVSAYSASKSATAPSSLDGRSEVPPTAIGRFPAYRLSPRLATPALDTYINLDPFVLGLLIPDDGGSTHLWNVGRQSFYTAVYPRRQLWTSYLW
jgi:hypothetical protein